MSLLSTHDYQRRRAERVLHLLQQLWGDDLPPGPHPELTVLMDAVAGDDHMGAHDGYVVQSDRLSYDALAVLLRRCTTPALAARALPRELLTRVFSATHQRPTYVGIDDSTASDVPHLSDRLSIHRRTDDDLELDRAPRTTPRTAPHREHQERKRNHLSVTAHPAEDHEAPPTTPIHRSPLPLPLPLPLPPSAARAESPMTSADPLRELGTWHLDASRQLLSWDDRCAAILERIEAPRHTSVLQELEEWTHPQDRPEVAAGFDRCIRGAHPHHARFRVLHPRGGWIACTASGQRVTDADGKVHVVGVLQYDRAVDAS